MVRRRLAGVLVVAMIGGCGALAAVVAPANAATGDVVSSIIAVRAPTSGCKSNDQQGNHSGVGTGIGFDGTNLILSCWGSAAIDFVNPTTGAYVKTMTPTGGADFGAMAFDRVTGHLWICNEDAEVGVVDLTANTFTKAFDSQGCVDGLAYDGSDNTIWAGADVASSVQHYKTDGTLIQSFPVSIGGSGKSGLAVGGTTLYIGNDGGAEIWQTDKSFTTQTVFIDSTKTGGRRVEDLECDNVTFNAQGKAVIWSQDAYDNILTAYEIPNNACVFGGSPTTTTTSTTASVSTTATTGGLNTTTTVRSNAAAAAVVATPRFTG